MSLAPKSFSLEDVHFTQMHMATASSPVVGSLTNNLDLCELHFPEEQPGQICSITKLKACHGIVYFVLNIIVHPMIVVELRRFPAFFFEILFNSIKCFIN